MPQNLQIKDKMQANKQKNTTTQTKTKPKEIPWTTPSVSIFLTKNSDNK